LTHHCNHIAASSGDSPSAEPNVAMSLTTPTLRLRSTNTNHPAKHNTIDEAHALIAVLELRGPRAILCIGVLKPFDFNQLAQH
jgi:hypothetical protein